MLPEDDLKNDDAEIGLAAGAAVGGHSNPWARQGRAAIQGSHTLTEPLARWAPELVEREPELALGEGGDNESIIVIPEAVLHARQPQRLPEDVVRRSPIAGLVIAVMAAPGEKVARHQTVLVIEAMKMLNHVSPAVDGVVKAMHVAPGDAVKAGQILFELA